MRAGQRRHRSLPIGAQSSEYWGGGQSICFSGYPWRTTRGHAPKVNGPNREEGNGRPKEVERGGGENLEQGARGDGKRNRGPDVGHL